MENTQQQQQQQQLDMASGNSGLGDEECVEFLGGEPITRQKDRQPVRKSVKDPKRKKDTTVPSTGPKLSELILPMPTTNVDSTYTSMDYLLDPTSPHNLQSAPWANSLTNIVSKVPRLSPEGKDYVCSRTLAYEYENIHRNALYLAYMNVEGAEISSNQQKEARAKALDTTQHSTLVENLLRTKSNRYSKLEAPARFDLFVGDKVSVQVTGHAPKGLFITKMFPGKDQDKNPTFQKWKTWISLKSLNNLLCVLELAKAFISRLHNGKSIEQIIGEQEQADTNPPDVLSASTARLMDQLTTHQQGLFAGLFNQSGPAI